MFPTGPITPLIISNYGISNSAAGLLTGTIYLVHVVFAIPSSLLIGRIGLKSIIFLGALTASAPSLSFLATDNFAFLITVRAIGGIGLVLLFPAIPPLFMQWLRPRELPFFNGFFMVFASLGIAISTLVVVPLSGVIGWAPALSVFGGMSFIGSVAWIVLGRAQPVARRPRSEGQLTWAWKGLFARNTLLIAAADAGPFALLTVSLAWLPTLYNQSHGISLAKGGALLSILSFSGVAALILASLLTARTRRRKPFLLFSGILVGFAAFASILLSDSLGLYLALAVLGFACWFFIPALITIPMELYPDNPQRVSLIFAALMSFEGVLCFVAPPIVGLIADTSGSFIPGLAIFATLAWSLAIAGSLLPETGTKGHLQ